MKYDVVVVGRGATGMMVRIKNTLLL